MRARIYPKTILLAISITAGTLFGPAALAMQDNQQGGNAQLHPHGPPSQYLHGSGFLQKKENITLLNQIQRNRMAIQEEQAIKKRIEYQRSVTESLDTILKIKKT